jgi:hypothetical protein
MLTAVWVAIVVAAAFWALAVCVGVYVMLRAARLITQTTAVVSGVRQRSESLMNEADAVTRRASEQVTKAESIAASMDEVTTTMAELNGRLTALGPAAKSLAEGAGLPLARVAAVIYGVARAVGMRRARGSRAGRPANGFRDVGARQGKPSFARPAGRPPVGGARAARPGRSAARRQRHGVSLDQSALPARGNGAPG